MLIYVIKVNWLIIGISTLHLLSRCCIIDDTNYCGNAWSFVVADEANNEVGKTQDDFLFPARDHHSRMGAQCVIHRLHTICDLFYCSISQVVLKYLDNENGLHVYSRGFCFVPYFFLLTSKLLLILLIVKADPFSFYNVIIFRNL